MNTEEHVELLVKTPEYRIGAYTIGEYDIILFVDEIVPIQSRIPSFIDGRKVKIVKQI